MNQVATTSTPLKGQLFTSSSEIKKVRAIHVELSTIHGTQHDILVYSFERVNDWEVVIDHRRGSHAPEKDLTDLRPDLS